MKILVLTKKFPFPVRDGESLAIHFLAKAYAELGCEVALLAMDTARHPADFEAFEAEKVEFAHFKNVWTAAVDNSIQPFSAFKNLFSNESYWVARHSSRAFDRRLAEVLKSENWDAVQLETAYLAAYAPTIRRFSGAKILLRAHNVEHEIWHRVAEGERFLPKKIYLKMQAARLAEFEKKALAAADLLVPITSRDGDFFRKMGFAGKAVVAPIGLDLAKYPPNWAAFEPKSLEKGQLEKVNPPSATRKSAIEMAFIGSLDWAPNAEGLRWFLDEIFEKMPPELRLKMPLRVAGRRPPAWLLAMKKPSLETVGEVPSAIDFLNESPIMIAPILSGSGIRAKILEGLALGRVVVATPVGLEGIDLKAADEAVFIAETPADWLAAFSKIDKMPLAELRKRGERGRAFVEKNFGHVAVARAVLDELFELKKEQKKSLTR